LQHPCQIKDCFRISSIYGERGPTFGRRASRLLRRHRKPIRYLIEMAEMIRWIQMAIAIDHFGDLPVG
jgi:hypothetical protein